MTYLKLIALDAEDLCVLSAHLQDAVVRIGDMAYLPLERRFAIVANRFDWSRSLATGTRSSGSKGAQPGHGERRRAGLRFERVSAARVLGLNLNDKSQALALLAISFEPAGGEPTAVDGHVTLTFSGGAAIRLDVECLEVELKDLGAAWTTKRIPAHAETETGAAPGDATTATSKDGSSKAE
ncbi:MAG: DUF2948 family protein [Hyphomicrobium sp.]